jgi:hypothetical protein
VSKNRADFIISDQKIISEKPLFIIGKDVEKPFSRSRLFMELERFEKNIESVHAVQDFDSELVGNGTYEDLEQEVEHITKEFVAKIMSTIKKYNAKTPR